MSGVLRSLRHGAAGGAAAGHISSHTPTTPPRGKALILKSIVLNTFQRPGDGAWLALTIGTGESDRR